jgi:hypothetical protein
MNRFWKRASMPQFRMLLPQVDKVDINGLIGATCCNRWALFGAKLLIGLISAYDVYLTIKYVGALPTYELNPVGRWLMRLDSGPTCELQQIAAFITAKFAGNLIALSVIELLASLNRSMAGAVALPVAAFQVWLLYYLMVGSH